MKKVELLSPSGDYNSLVSAIMAGADAVYLGGKNYGARAFSSNFSNEEIVEAINFAHLYGVKVYVTVNTLVYDNEVEEFLNYIEFLHKNNVDAVIMQDIGMVDLVRKVYPNLEIHASTQMHIHNLEGAKLLEKLGVKRVVLARETSLEVIKQIKENTNLEIEIFVHGALCICSSGQCLMSSLIKNRSGNRGKCAGNCRLKYDLVDTNKKKVNNDQYLLSTKDLCTIEYLKELIDIGVDSIKIEGRMKREEYVFLVTSLYRKMIDTNKVELEDIKELKKIYNRKFTKGFIFGEKNNDIVNQYRPNHMGIEIGKVINTDEKYVTIKLTDYLHQEDGIRILSNDDSGFIVNYIYKNKKLVKEAYKGDIIKIPLKDKVKINYIVLKTTDYIQINSIKESLKNIKRKVIINGKIIIKTLKNVIFTISDGVNSVSIISDFQVQKSINKPLKKEDILKQMSKLGDTVYEFDNLDIDMDDDCFILISDLNKLRRDIIDKLNEKRLYKIPFVKEKYSIEVKDYQKEKNENILISRYEDYKNDPKYKYIFIDNKEVFDKIDDPRKVLKIDRVVNKYNNYDDLLLVGELGSINYYNNVFVDFSLNITNSYAVALMHSLGVNMVTLSYEMGFEEINNLIKSYKKRYNANPNLEVIVYGKEELMISKFNLLKMYNLEDGYLKDIFGNLYHIKNGFEFMKIYNNVSRNICNINDYFEIGVNNVRYNFDD